MVYGDQVKIVQFLNSLAQGFVQTRLEIQLLFLFLIALFLIFAGYLAAQKVSADRQMRRRSRELLEHLLLRLELNAEETALLGRLARHLDRAQPEYTLLVSRRAFDACADRALLSGDASVDRLNALRLKIGFHLTRPDEVPASSTELPEGSPVILAWTPGRRARATIVAQAPAAMMAKLDQGVPPPARGARLRAYFHNSAGVFTFLTRVGARAGDAMLLEHSSRITRFQRRRYYRRAERLPVLVTSAEAIEGSQETVLLDLGGGGASLQNPGENLRKGDFLDISFSPSVGKLTLEAQVLRVSKDRKVVHVRFQSPSESERNRIMGFLFGQSGRRGTESRAAS
ncbi:MAG TPA: PilZ domain-containing protein [Spirochaetia bacterium]|nr:PilZ domain-containing protein [Spirochaetia bacterium]